MSAGEVLQAAGSRAIYQMANEASWGTVNPSPNWRRVRLLPNETIDQNLATYRSQQMRGDRGRTASVRGSQKPGGSLPFELSPNGWNNIFYHLLGGAVTTTGPIGGLTTPSAATGTPSTNGGVLPAATYSYKITALNAVGETLPSTASTGVTTTGTTGSVAIAWSAVTGATGYNIYGRTGASFLLLGTVGTGVLTFTDTGATVPAGAVPGSSTAGSVYTQVFAGGLDVPAGFTLEKGFTDIGQYYAFYGCRVNKMDIDFSIDKIATGSFDILARQAGEPSQASLNSSSIPSPPLESPFTSVQINLSQNGVALARAESLKLSISNNFYDARGFVMGSTLRQNLRPGDRTTDASGEFMFTDGELYEMAIRGTPCTLNITASNGVYSVGWNMTNFQFLPNKTTPKAKDSGPITIAMNGEADTDNSLGTDVTMTILTPEATITT